MIDLTMELIQKLLKDGFGLGFLVTLILLLRKRLRNQQLNARDIYWTALHEAMARKVGVQWDADLIAIRNSAARDRSFSLSSIRIFARSARERRAHSFTTCLNSRGIPTMKELLRKLGKTKFQAYLILTVVNIATFILSVQGSLQVDATIDKWMPLMNLAAQMIATVIYQHIEGSIDREAQKQQVYVVPGSAQPVVEPVPVEPVPTIDSLDVSEIMSIVGSVNAELNDYMEYIKAHPDQIGKEAAARYLQIRNMLSTQGPILNPNETEGK
ncbi:hypothetical protein LOZ80_38125 [Paenibacillus sp. HWE-109]|uniref:hypothetical protein n=1 Tax=Paenibacillus sp. HWE-109 TaxID=1306526 RepID=UPI001EDE03A3|nr:hypothetical protein [Paenibacillus sp. HWE-109]UKS27211.1 hypothetical protein LOZ80_38125 [Paenibacillus sp. HWE-109]